MVSLPVIPVGKHISYSLIKVVVLSLEIKDCTFKLSITPGLSGLNRPNDSNQALQFAAAQEPFDFISFSLHRQWTAHICCTKPCVFICIFNPIHAVLNTSAAVNHRHVL